MTKLEPRKAGLALGALLGLWHICWSLLLALGWAQPLMDWIFQLHMIAPIFQVVPFNFGLAIMLIVVTSVIGYLMGWVLAYIWNRVHRA